MLSSSVLSRSSQGPNQQTSGSLNHPCMTTRAVRGSLEERFDTVLTPCGMRGSKAMHLPRGVGGMYLQIIQKEIHVWERNVE